MIYTDEAFYVIGRGFGLGRKGCMGSYGFAIGLDPKYAKRFYEKEITQQQSDNLDRHGKKIVRDIFDLEEESFINTPYHFLKNEKGNLTLLLQWCSVIGNTCDLGIDGMNLDRIKRWQDDSLIEYEPHNVDTLHQAFGLLTLWNEWAAIAYGVTRED